MQLIAFSIRLKNGKTALIREVGPADRHLLQAGFDRLSDQSRYFRFLAAHPRLSAAELTNFTAPNDDSHVAIGALVQQGGGDGFPAGIARYVRLPDTPGVAEIAVTIVDGCQGQGLGSLLLGVLARYARKKGLTGFTALVHHDNDRMLGLLEQLCGRQGGAGGNEVEFHLPLLDDAAGYPDNGVGDAFRRAYRLARFTEG